MKFNVSSKTLYSYVSAVSKVINSKNALTILNNFLFELSDNTLTITASDLENTLVAHLEVMDAEGEGKFCVDARRMVDLLKEMPDQGISFDINDDNLAVEIVYPSGNYSFIAINGNEYPSNESVDESTDIIEFTCPTEQIIKGIDNTLFAVGNDDLRPQMMGILWDIKPDAITFVATDTRKLVKYRNAMSAPGVEGSCILPIKPATVIKNVFAKEDEVKVTLEPKSATFESPSYKFNCRFIKGSFPDYNRVIPVKNPYVITVDRQSFLNAVRRVGVFVDQGHGLVKFKIEKDQLTMKATDNNFCTSAREVVPCDFTGTEMIIGFSAPYLIEIFNTISTTDILIKLSDPSRPGVFVPSENSENSELLMLLMPMTVSDF
ncbi:DNA polymerase III subunit beta [Muribaculum sp. NM65_B17]|jgi:DNA polymerase III, beta subunit|uniref:DNA polymerase III subunit beta n=6 Tax=Muribaculum TaxID=1918540 RepID=UPI001093B12F|nr:DNA polymerase III subunit beta [Muribaculum sp. NM65_B17]TGY05574.1 DNA polymerase III subunit beta [Muribaculum sp. NM65_B17]THG42913.1 DNA polymerase III subunit beta [Muribaculaceae bacterium]